MVFPALFVGRITSTCLTCACSTFLSQALIWMRLDKSSGLGTWQAMPVAQHRVWLLSVAIKLEAAFQPLDGHLESLGLWIVP